MDQINQPSFLLQTINHKVTLDFVFQLERNIEYQLWRGENVHYTYSEIDDIGRLSGVKNEIPVGTIEFVTKYINEFLDPNYIPKPLNIPPELLVFRKNIIEWDGISPVPWDEVYIKSQTNIKHPLNGYYCKDSIYNLPEGSYQVSKYVKNIASEWRCFVKMGCLIDCRCYSGNFTTIPDFDKIKNMIKTYGKPEPYTLDVFVTDLGETEILECHRFWACGLYGFDDPGLMQMFSQGYFDEIKNIN